ncbi:MAG: Outer membrane protein assembly factor BamA [candidate division TM6 bacterium GW2011_GWF2_37_49]|nr:MAG: Outer membrane protein assembly factor BamA [candidate division TM6 bacterium GW2011_GWF2_37_49]
MFFGENKFFNLNLFVILIFLRFSYAAAADNSDKDAASILATDAHQTEQLSPEIEEEPSQKINKIIVKGNKYVRKDVILARIPYKEGDVFAKDKTSIAINNLYDLGYFRQIQIEKENLGNESINLCIHVAEKKLLEKIEFKGNKSINAKKFKETLNLDKISTIDHGTVQKLIKEMKKAYREEQRHKVSIAYELIENKENPDKVKLVFNIKEGPKSTVVRVFFVGNKEIPERKLRKIAFTRENWLLSFTDNAGVYSEEMVDVDKHKIEYFYRDYGFMQAKVYKTDVKFSPNNRDVSVTYHISEGPKYTVRSISANGDEIFGEDELMPLISLEKGKPYSQANLVNSMNRLRELWGEKGYIYADVYPQIKPDEDTHEVDVTFHVERGNLMYVNRINITGNNYTRDKVIRRQLDIFEGDLITSKKLKRSQNQVEYLSYFERGSIDWKIHRISDDLADLEMKVQEAKTGNFNVMASYGSDKFSPRPSLKGAISLEKNNLFGLGYDVGGMIQANRHRLQRIEGHFFDANLFDTDLSGAFEGYKNWIEYEYWTNVNRTPVEKILGFTTRLGFPLTKIDKRLQLFADLSFEHIRNNNPKSYNPMFEIIVNRTFQRGDLFSIGLDLVKDTRNHKVYPNEGYKVMLSTRMAPTPLNNNFGFMKTQIEGSWFTSVIGKDDLVFGLHILAGRVSSLTNDHTIPYKELYQIGGQNTVRGFLWGGISPAWINGSPLGARNAMLLNAELTFPLVKDYSMKGHVFYDTGAGWSTPKNDVEDPKMIKRDKFNLRHAVGFGFNLTNPVPAKIDWGYKLDRKPGEPASEFHLSMNYAF